MGNSANSLKAVLLASTVLIAAGCAEPEVIATDPGPPVEANIPSIQDVNPPVSEPDAVGDPRALETLEFEDITRGLEPGIELSNEAWDPWNNIALTWTEIFSSESRSIPSHPYIARNFEATKFYQPPAGQTGTLGLIDPTPFCADKSSECIGSDDADGSGTGHGHRMALNALHQYPGAGVQALSHEAFFLPFLGEVDGRYQAMSNQLGVDNLTNSRLFAISSFALQDSDRAKVMAVASNRRWEFNDTDGLWNGSPFGQNEEDLRIATSQGPAFLKGYEWILSGEDSIRVETPDHGPWTLNQASYEWAQWWEENAGIHNTLLVSSNSNYQADQRGDMIDCFPESGGLTPDLDQLCGVTDTAIAVSGKGLANTLFVCAYDPSQSTVIGNHSGPFAENTIYASGAAYGDTKSCSQATPIVAAVALEVADTNTDLSAAQLKKVLMASADQKRVARTVSVSAEGVSRQVTEVVPVLNRSAALRCARNLECIG